jgi:type IV pilus assembly protein PilY1
MFKPTRFLSGAAGIWLAASLAPASWQVLRADQLNLAQAPLFLTTSATPNVMLLLDNSGSLNNIIWADAYNSGTAYTDWSSGGSYWDPGNGNVLFSDLDRGTCSGGYVRGKNGSTTKCLKLPDPVGGSNTRYTGNYLNYLFSTYANNKDLTDGTIPLTFRLGVSKTVSANVVNNNANLRFGVAKFNTPTSKDNGPSGYIAAANGSTTATVLDQINGSSNGLKAEANTPLAETFYEITRYFRGMSSYYNSGKTYTSPIQYSCQKNFVVVITDGLPTWDNQFPTDDPADVADTSHSLPNWDGVATATTADQYPNFPSGSDGYDPTAASADEGRTLFLDDLAQFGYDIDLSGSFAGKQNLQTYTIGLTTDNNMLRDAADASHGRGAYYTANNQTQLQTALQAAISSIIAQNGDFSSVAANSTRLDTGTRVIQASFNSGNWSGDLKAYQVYDGKTACSTGSQSTLGELCSSPVWSASTQLDGVTAASRTILSYKPSTHAGIPFLWASLDASQQALLKSGSADTDSNGTLRLNYLRGDRSTEGQTATPRARGSKLGDIVNSSPFYVGPPAFSYGDSGYAAFKQTYASRAPMVYVAANDGMLHGFQVSNGKETLAYVPSLAFGSGSNKPLYALTQTPFVHAPIVDASPTVGDVQVGGSWKSVLVGGLGGGGRGIYALDVTNPATFSQSTAAAASTVLWEFTSADDGDLGYSFSQPSIVKMRNGKWAAVFGNGYSTTTATTASGQASLFIVFIDGPDSSGAWGSGKPATASSKYVKISTGVGGTTAATGANSPNGLAAPAAVDVDSDGTVDYFYAGDERGNLWRFDVTDASPANWAVGNGGAALFTATSASGVAQPITERPEVGFNLLADNATDADNPRLAIYFGTGRYLDSSDTGTTGVQSFYGIFDKFSASAVTINRSDRGSTNILVKQQITQELNASGSACTGNAITASGSCFRVTSNSTVSAANYGWFIDLYNSAGGNGATAGERQVTTPILRGGKIIFTTLIPSTDTCTPGGGGWLMELNAKTGSAFSSPVFNTNGDRVVDDNDYITLANGTRVAVSGLRSNVGIPTTPGIITIPGNLEVKYRAGSGNNGATLETLVESASGRVGRITWREIQK